MPYRSSHTGASIDSAISAVLTKQKEWDAKQDRIWGTCGEILTFDGNGNPISTPLITLLPAEIGHVADGGTPSSFDTLVFDGGTPFTTDEIRVDGGTL